ncbi:MAG TPA: hypothetical protein VGP93_17515, partial [Polyangiaceae bacterium]|nr:hypothetical protein [Polyangiaceae bacterium]
MSGAQGQWLAPVLLLTALAGALHVIVRWRRQKASRRPLLVMLALAAAALSALPALSLTGIAELPQVRFERPLLGLPA